MTDQEIDFALREYYDKRAPTYDEWYERRGSYNNPKTNPLWFGDLADVTRNLTRLAATVAHKKQVRVLDIACGSGKWLLPFAKNLPPDGRVIGLDTSPAMLQLARERILDEDPDGQLLSKIDLIRGDAYDLPFRAAAFDIVFAGFWLGHVPRDRVSNFLAAVRRILKDDGQFFVLESAQEANVPNEEIIARQVSDNSVYPVLKIRYGASELQALLEGAFGTKRAAVKATRRYFVLGGVTK